MFTDGGPQVELLRPGIQAVDVRIALDVGIPRFGEDDMRLVAHGGGHRGETAAALRRELALEEPGRFAVIDATAAMDDVTRAMIDAVEARIGEPNGAAMRITG